MGTPPPAIPGTDLQTRHLERPCPPRSKPPAPVAQRGVLSTSAQAPAPSRASQENRWFASTVFYCANATFPPNSPPPASRLRKGFPPASSRGAKWCTRETECVRARRDHSCAGLPVPRSPPRSGTASPAQLLDFFTRHLRSP